MYPNALKGLNRGPDMAAATAAAAAVAVVTALYQLAWPVPEQGTKRMYTFLLLHESCH
jgi:hypothetical protein